MIQLDVPDLGLSIRIKDRISKYRTVGTFLLNDDQGLIMNRIMENHNRVEERIDEMFERWINGQGQKKSNTWGTLVTSLKYAEENYLADEIERILKYCEEAQKYMKCTFGNAELRQEKSKETNNLPSVTVGATVVLGALVIVTVVKCGPHSWRLLLETINKKLGELIMTCKTNCTKPSSRWNFK